MIPLIKIKVDNKTKRAVKQVLDCGMLAQGERVAELEKEVLKYCGTKYAVAVSSGTAALHLALLVAGIKSGDEVITTPFTFAATANAILMAGAKPVFADIDKNTFLIAPKDVEHKLTEKTKAIIPVDIFGRIYDVPGINRLAKKHNLTVIEDACQAIGAKYEGEMAGSLGDTGVFSFYATKNLFAGEGGILVTDNEKWAQKARLLRHHGQSGEQPYDYLDFGYNYRMTEIEAVIALSQLKNIDKQNTRRVRNAVFYNDCLKNVNGLVLPKASLTSRQSVFHLYTTRITENVPFSRDKFVDYLQNAGIATGIYYPKPLHFYPHFKKLGYEKGDFPVAERVCREVVSLPVYPGLTTHEKEHIKNTINSIFK